MKKFIYLLAALSLGFAACDKADNSESGKSNETESATLTITSGETMEVTHEGGSFEITYTLEGASKGAKPTTSCNASWITDLTVGDTITFYIPVNETEESRIAPILISYGNNHVQVIVKQLSKNEAALKASFFGGEYYGSVYSPGMGNYYLHLSDNGFNDKGYDMPNSKYYCLDLYGPLYEGPDGGEIKLPHGTYTLNTDSENRLWTMSWEYSGYRETNENGESYDPYLYDNATLVVDAEGATFECFIEGVEHRVRFNGEATIIDARY
ncbi:MAG: BACON domain-containing protein [Alistipes sp.]|nr:BACON domain-containing protein [Alistipes sp.]